MILEIAGSLDAELALKLRYLADRAVSATPDLMVFDLMMVHSLSTAGVAEIRRVHGARPMEKVRVVATNEVILRSLKPMRLAGELDVYATLQAASDRT